MFKCVLSSCHFIISCKMSWSNIDSFDCLRLNHHFIYSKVIGHLDYISCRIADDIRARILYISIRHRWWNIFIHLLHFIAILKIGWFRCIVLVSCSHLHCLMGATSRSRWNNNTNMLLLSVCHFSTSSWICFTKFNLACYFITAIFAINTGINFFTIDIVTTVCMWIWIFLRIWHFDDTKV